MRIRLNHYGANRVSGEVNFIDWDRTIGGVDGGFALVERHGSEAGGGRKEAREIAYLRVDVEGLVHCIIAQAGEALEEAIARHCPGVPVAALIFVERVADAAVVAVAA